MRPHVHAEIIKAWADGHQIQFRNAADGQWFDVQNHSTPAFNTFQEYRVKPKQQFVTQEYHLYLPAGCISPVCTAEYPPNVRMIFENGKLIDVELIGNE